MKSFDHLRYYRLRNHHQDVAFFGDDGQHLMNYITPIYISYLELYIDNTGMYR